MNNQFKDEDMQGVVAAKDEEIMAEMQEQKRILASDPAKNPLIAKFTQLWFACYFERRLTRQKVENSDL